MILQGNFSQTQKQHDMPRYLQQQSQFFPKSIKLCPVLVVTLTPVSTFKRSLLITESTLPKPRAATSRYGINAAPIVNFMSDNHQGCKLFLILSVNKQFCGCSPRSNKIDALKFIKTKLQG